MKWLITVLLLVCPKLVIAETLTYYILPSGLFQGANRTALKSRETIDKIQPFRGKAVLLPKNTDYILTTVEPEDAPLALQPFFQIYQQYEFENGRMWLSVDHSDVFDVDKNWLEVKISSK